MLNIMNVQHENMNVAQDVVDAFGGLTKTAKALQHKSCSTIFYWIQAGHIPRWRYGEIENAASNKGIKLPQSFWKSKRQ